MPLIKSMMLNLIYYVTTKETKQYLPVITLSAKDNQKL